jgi:hypothetical protein
MKKMSTVIAVVVISATLLALSAPIAYAGYPGYPGPDTRNVPVYANDLGEPNGVRSIVWGDYLDDEDGYHYIHHTSQRFADFPIVSFYGQMEIYWEGSTYLANEPNGYYYTYESELIYGRDITQGFWWDGEYFEGVAPATWMYTWTFTQFIDIFHNADYAQCGLYMAIDFP